MHICKTALASSNSTLIECLLAPIKLGLALIVGGWAISSHAEAVVEVNSPSELSDALKFAQAGTTLELAPGDFGALNLSGTFGTPTRPLTLRAADPDNPPRISQMLLRNVENVIIEALLFDYSYQADDKPYLRPFQVVGSENVKIQQSTFDGDIVTAILDEPPSPTAFALTIADSRNVHVADSVFHTFLRGILVSQSNEIIISGNELHSLRSDGLNLAEVGEVLIQNNYIHDFDRMLSAGDHADFIQFWTTQTKAPSANITIRGNTLNSGDGWYTQSIFMRNEVVDTALSGREMFYRNIVIEDNVIINAHLHGITVGETDGLIIRNNSVIRNARSEGPDDNPALWTPQIRVSPASTNVTINGNVTSKVEGFADQPDWNVEGNFFIQDRESEQPGYYDQIFISARTGDPSRLENFAPLPGGPLDGSGIGSSILAKLEGKAPASGQTEAPPTSASMPKSDLLSLDANADALTMLSGVQRVAMAHPSISNGVIRLADSDQLLTVPSDVISPLFGARDFVFSFRLRGSGSYRHPGDILYITKTLAVSVTGRGALNVDIVDSDGKMRNVKSPGSRLYEATWRDVVVRYSGKRQSISISIDGKTVAERPFSGLPSHGKWDMTFGSPLKDGVTFVGELSDLRLTINTE